MMNNYNYYFYLLLGVFIALSSCTEEYETVFDERPDQRVQRALDEYNTLLMSAPNGWKAELTTGVGRKYFYYFDFNEEGQVTIVSDFNETTAGTPAMGSWVIKALQKPTLSFDTYSYIHLPADPSGSVNGGSTGEGLVSDFEFSFEEQLGDSVIFKGILRGADLAFVPATASEAEAILNKQVFNVLSGTKTYIEAEKGIQLVLPDNTRVPLVIDVQNRLFGAQYLAQDNSINMFESNFTFSIDGIELKSPFEINGYSIDHLTWKEEEAEYYVDLDGSTMLERYNDPFVMDATPALHSLLGEKYPYIVVPEGSGQQPLHGQSEDFITAYNAAADAMLAGEYQLTLRDIRIFFDQAEELMEFQVIISQPNGSGGDVLFIARYIYNYEKGENGVLKFNFQTADSNGWLIYGDLYPMLFNIESDHFEAAYIAGDLNLIGGLFSQEHPGYYLSGYLSANE